jgi:hypothetical protein
MSHVERYHTPLSAVYLKIRSTCGHDIIDADVLHLGVRAFNYTVFPEELCPTCLVFGSAPRPAAQIALARSFLVPQRLRNL